LAAPHETVNVAAGNLVQQALEEVVQTLPCVLFRHLHVPDGLAQATAALFGHINLGVRRCFYSGLGSILRPPSRYVDGQWLAASPPHVSWSSTSRPSRLGRQGRQAPASSRDSRAHRRLS